jgi:membrane protein involved in colicin uptake
MSRSHNEERFPDDLQKVADVLRDGRPALSPLELDQVKLRAMSAARHSTSPRKGSFMRSRLTTVVTAAFIALGTGGALALSGGGGGGSVGSASFHEYRCTPHNDHHCRDHEREERERERKKRKEREEREHKEAEERRHKEHEERGRRERAGHKGH